MRPTLEGYWSKVVSHHVPDAVKLVEDWDNGTVKVFLKKETFRVSLMPLERLRRALGASQSILEKTYPKSYGSNDSSFVVMYIDVPFPQKPAAEDIDLDAADLPPIEFDERR